MKVEMWCDYEEKCKTPKALIKAIDEYIDYSTITKDFNKKQKNSLLYILGNEFFRLFLFNCPFYGN